MDLLGTVLMVIAIIGLLVCGIWMIILQFQTSILWGLACIFIPFAALVWLAMYWNEGKKPFLISLAFFALLIGGAVIGPGLSGLIPNIPNQT